MRFTYPARSRPDSTGELIVSIRDLPECLTSGASEAEALAEAADALEEAIAGRISRGDIPVPSARRSGERHVAVSVAHASPEREISARGFAKPCCADNRRGQTGGGHAAPAPASEPVVSVASRSSSDDRRTAPATGSSVVGFNPSLQAHFSLDKADC